jgi:hypothetical protein
MTQFRTLESQIDEIIINSEKRMLVLMQQSIQAVVQDAQTPVAKGGRMRVDTGFLRASGQGAIGGPPSGPVRGEKPEGDYAKGSVYPSDEGAAVVLLLGTMTLGQTFYFGWSAGYAKYREAYDGFLEGALANWPKYVAANTAKIKKRFAK